MGITPGIHWAEDSQMWYAVTSAGTYEFFHDYSAAEDWFVSTQEEINNG